MEAIIKLTERMLSKSEINANKTVRQFLSDEFDMDYTDPFFKENKFTVTGEYIDGTEAKVNFFTRSGRGDKMISIQKLKQYANAGDEVHLSSEWDANETRIFISIHKTNTEASTHAA